MAHSSPGTCERVVCDKCAWRGLSSWSDKKSKAELMKHMKSDH